MKSIVPIPTRKWHNNPLYPLPPDYESYGGEEARLVRVNACRQWCLKRSQILLELTQCIEGFEAKSYEEQLELVEQYREEAFVACIRFFDEYYLKPDPDNGFDPLFYDEEPLPTPSYHHDFARDTARYAATIEVAPRGSAKTMYVRKPIMLCMLSRPAYKILYCTSSDKNGKETASLVRNQLYTNTRIIKDWGPEMPTGHTKPSRGVAQTGIEVFQLTNASQLAIYSVNSKLRGGRPRWFILDDPEHDPHASTSMAERRAYMNRLIFKVALPMLQRRECRLTWLATFVSKRHFAWMACETETFKENGKVVQRAKIPEFDMWNRRIIKACKQLEDGSIQSCWPEMWPVDEREKKALGLDPTTKTLDQIKKIIGSANFNSEYMANPGSDGEVFFKLEEQRHGYSFLRNTIDDKFYTSPKESKAVIRWMEGDLECSAQLDQFLLDCKTFITIDTSKTATVDSDFKVATLMALNKSHDLFVLDMWAGQVGPDRLIKESLQMAFKWGCRYICPEEIEDGIVLARTMKNYLRRLSSAGESLLKVPLVKGFNPGFTRKVTKISALSLRVEHGKIKLPFFARMRKPWFDLFEQFEGFNPDVDDGGLSHDDHLDTVCMSEYIIASKVVKKHQEEIEEQDVLKLMAKGESFTKDGTSLATFLDLAKVPVDELIVVKERPKAANLI